VSFTSVWEFEVAAGQRAEFVRRYGPEGDWVALFRRAPGYVDTRLLADRTSRTRFLTLDRWRSPEDYEAFQAQHRADYDALDRKCEGLTVREAHLGSFSE
jgi:heme-degrading monooxygenase HmoA